MAEKIAVALKSFNARVGKLTANNTKFKNEMQELLCIAAQYAFADEKNVSPFTNLVIRDGAWRFDGVDNVTLIRWIEAHAPARWDNKELKFRFNKSFVGEYDAIALLSSPWWKKQVKASEVASSIDFLEMVRGFVKRMEREAAVEVDGKKRDVKHAALLLQMQNIANAAEYTEGV